MLPGPDDDDGFFTTLSCVSCLSVCVCACVCLCPCVCDCLYPANVCKTHGRDKGQRNWKQDRKKPRRSPSRNHPRKFSNLLMDDNLRFKWSARAGIGGWPIKNKTNSIRAPAREATIASQCPGPIVCLMKERCSGKFLKDFTGSCLISEGGRK